MPPSNRTQLQISNGWMSCGHQCRCAGQAHGTCFTLAIALCVPCFSAVLCTPPTAHQSVDLPDFFVTNTLFFFFPTPYRHKQLGGMAHSSTWCFFINHANESHRKQIALQYRAKQEDVLCYFLCIFREY